MVVPSSTESYTEPELCIQCGVRPRRPKTGNGRTPVYCSHACVSAAYKVRKRGDVLAQGRAYMAARRAKDPDAARARNRLYMRVKNGILGATAEQRAGVCPVCLKDGPLVLDHDHATGKIRGWLCSMCNAGLGKIGDTLAAAERLTAYLRAHADSAGHPPDAFESLARGSTLVPTTSEG